MKAIRVHEFGPPEVLRLEEVPDPRPGQGEVLVRIKAAGVNPYDTYMRTGTYGANNPALPYTPGSDAAGVVEALGAGVEDLAVGDRVFAAGTRDGAYAELAVCAREQLHRLPRQITCAQGAGIWIAYATAYRSLFQLGHGKPGETVLVHGASGGVGLAALQFARAAGLTVIGTAGSDRGLELLERQGVHHVFNHRSADYQKRILELTRGGVHLIIEMLANINLANDLKMLAQHGRIVVVGSRGDVQITPREIMMREATVTGVFLWRLAPEHAREIHAALQAGLSNGTLAPVVGLELPLSAAPEAHRRILEPGTHGKIVLLP